MMPAQKKLYQKIIEDYIDAYNHSDIDGMLSNMHEDVRFEHISNDEVTLSTNGMEELRSQAKQAASAFREREQKIITLEFFDSRVEAMIFFHGVLAFDLPNGMKAGERIELNGKSVFRFEDDKIIELQDRL